MNSKLAGFILLLTAMYFLMVLTHEFGHYMYAEFITKGDCYIVPFVNKTFTFQTVCAFKKNVSPLTQSLGFSFMGGFFAFVIFALLTISSRLLESSILTESVFALYALENLIHAFLETFMDKGLFTIHPFTIGLAITLPIWIKIYYKKLRKELSS